MRHKSFKFRVLPTKDQETFFDQQAGACRFVWNKLLEENIKYHEKTGKFRFGFNILDPYLKIKAENPWLKDSIVQCHHQVGMFLSQAFRNTFSKKYKKNTGFPGYKSKRNSRPSFRVPQNFKVSGNRIKLPKIGWIKIINSRKLEGKVKSLIFTKDVDRWFVSILCEIEPVTKYVDPENVVGLDVGISDFVVTSDGEVFNQPDSLTKHYKKLKKLQRSHARKQKGGKNREKARIKLAKQFRKIRNINKNFVETISSVIIKQYDVVSMETLNITGMKKNRKLSRSIQERPWYALKMAIKRKAGYLHEVSRWFPSSKLCSVCDFKNQELTLGDRCWICPNCGESHDRDTNAARNMINNFVRTVATAGIVCGENVRLVRDSVPTQADLVEAEMMDPLGSRVSEMTLC